MFINNERTNKMYMLFNSAGYDVLYMNVHINDMFINNVQYNIINIHGGGAFRVIRDTLSAPGLGQGYSRHVGFNNVNDLPGKRQVFLFSLPVLPEKFDCLACRIDYQCFG